jgi:hypothetical protein
MLLKVGFSRPISAPSANPHTEAVANMSPVLAALVMLMPKVKHVWAVMNPRHPNPAM